MDETPEEKAAREAEEAAAAEAKAAEEKAAREAELAAMTDEERAAKEAADAKAAEEAAAAAAKKDEPGDVTTVQIGEEAPPVEEKAPGWVREVRQKNRELAKENAELRKRVDGQHQAAGAMGKEPTLEDYDYDADKFKTAYAEWFGKKKKADEQAAQVVEAQKSEQAAWQTKLDAYGAAKAAIKVPDIDEAEALVQETLSEKQQAIILKGAKNPALLVYALGKNPAKAKELAAITDLVEFAFAVANVESQLKITKKPAPPAPEKKVEGTGPKSGTVDSTLERLRAEAERTGDYTKVHAYKNQKKAA